MVCSTFVSRKTICAEERPFGFQNNNFKECVMEVHLYRTWTDDPGIGVDFSIMVVDWGVCFDLGLLINGELRIPSIPLHSVGVLRGILFDRLLTQGLIWTRIAERESAYVERASAQIDKDSAFLIRQYAPLVEIANGES
ncbi:MAG: hypothetical protein KW804_01445 [Candidatus Doudnabacteria bacterium]|nr:hypothetical protein [Candidatus Doudnabacteria bacterium]